VLKTLHSSFKLYNVMLIKAVNRKMFDRRQVFWTKVHPKNLGQDSFWLNVEKDSLASEDLFEALEENCGSTAVSKSCGEEKKPKKTAKAFRVLDAKAAHSLSIVIQSSFSIRSLQ